MLFNISDYILNYPVLFNVLKDIKKHSILGIKSLFITEECPCIQMFGSIQSEASSHFPPVTMVAAG